MSTQVSCLSLLTRTDLLLSSLSVTFIDQIKNETLNPVMLALAFNPSTREAKQVEFEASLVYRGSSRTARAVEKPCLEKPNNTTTE